MAGNPFDRICQSRIAGLTHTRAKQLACGLLGVILVADVFLISWIRAANESEAAGPPARLRRLQRWGSGAAESSAVSSLVTIFSTECTAYHDWQSVVLYDSWVTAKVPGRLVRILACSEAQRRTYSHFDDLGERLETHVHEKGTFGVDYSPLNKPWGIMSWLTEGKGSKLSNETVVLIVDPDMSFRPNFVPGDLAKLAQRVSDLKGTALGLDYRYTVAGMRATDWALPRHFNSSRAMALQSIGPPILIRKQELQRLVHGWHGITLQIVMNKSLHALVHDGDQFAPWIAEMYGYTLGAAGWLWHETQAQWSELEVPQPPFASTGGRSLPDPLLIHYSHTFELCGKRFGKSMYRFSDPLRCTASGDVLENLRPPTYKETQASSCKLCISGGDVIGFNSKCFGEGPGQAYIKHISWQAWARVARAIFRWRSRHCFAGATDHGIAIAGATAGDHGIALQARIAPQTKNE